MPQLVSEIAKSIGAKLLGESTVEISGIASLQSAAAGHLVFVDDKANLATALNSAAGAVLAGEFAAASKTKKTLLIVRDPKLAFARAARLLHPPRRQPPGIHSTSVVHHSAKIGKGVSIGPNV